MEVIQKCLAEDQALSVWMFEEMTGINRETVRKMLVEVGTSIFRTTMHWRNEASPCHPIHCTPLI
jgi:hypothetical protein